MGTISKRGREKQAVRDTPGGLRIVYGLGAISGKDTKSSIQRCQIITGRRMEKAVQKAAVNREVNNCVYNWTSDRITGRFATANEVKSVTSHEVINNYYSSSSTASSGGGGGWFGGNYGLYGQSGAGGSGYVDGVAPFTHNGKYYPAETEAGVNDGNGKAFIRYVECA